MPPFKGVILRLEEMFSKTPPAIWGLQPDTLQLVELTMVEDMHDLKINAGIGEVAQHWFGDSPDSDWFAGRDGLVSWTDRQRELLQLLDAGTPAEWAGQWFGFSSEGL